VDEIVLRASGRKLELELGAALIPTPKLKRTIEGASTIESVAEDPERRLLRHLLVSQKWDVELDGLHFRYPGAYDKQGDQATLTLEDRWVAILREHVGPVKVVRGSGPHQMTRAEFIKMLVEKAAPNLDFYCPELHRVQPLKNKAQAKKAKKESRANLGKGIGDVKHLKVKGVAASKAQLELGQTALEIAASEDAVEVVEVALICALIDENDMQEPNVLQAEGKPEGAPIGSAEEEISGFLSGKPEWTGTTAIGYHKAHPSATAAEIATAVQANRDGASVYARYEAEAKDWIDAFGGGEGGSIDVTQPYEFKVAGKEKGHKKAETYWEAIQRLAKDVNWRAFIVGSRFFYMPEPEMLQGEVRLAIDAALVDDPESGIEDVNFEYDGNSPVAEVEVEALVSQWQVPPGAVFTLADYGPASIGFGDQRVKKGEVGLSSNRNAQTGEGRARYLVTSIEVPLSNDPAQRLAIITGKKPTAPLPEPAAETTSVSGASPSAAGNKTVERMLAAAEREAEKKLPYIWGGFDPSKGFDCSGGVSWVLDIGGFMTGRTDTQGLSSWGEPGPGDLITVYIKTTGSAEEEHTAIEIAGIVFESGGGSENGNPEGGWGKVDSSQVKDFLKQFDTKRHPKGF
jgi:cell wall-associated NlpC family hydrolase